MHELPLRVAVQSPQAIVAEGLRAILATVSGHVEIVPLDTGLADPDVVLYDAIGLLHGDSTDLDILVNKTASSVLVVSHDLRPGLAAEALAAGADGHFSLAAGRAEILEAIDSAVTGWRIGDAGESPVVGSGDSVTGKSLVGGARGLSQRETQILGLVGQGWLNSEIAAELYLSPNTVKTYIRSAYRKIGATNRAQAASWAVTHGLAALSTT
jgi:DNA-binding NarL/FixJ family response regulator